MKFQYFEDAFSADRMGKYVSACNGDTRRAMMLYRCNLRLSQEMFTLVSCFEVTLRNRIDRPTASPTRWRLVARCNTTERSVVLRPQGGQDQKNY